MHLLDDDAGFMMTDVPAPRHELAAAIADLYTVFARYPLRPWTYPCPCCQSPESERRLHMSPLKELSDDDLRPFAWSVFNTWGDERDFKHFLPRMCELAAEGKLDLPTGLLGTKFMQAKWSDWAVDERSAVTSWWMAHFTAEVTAATPSGDVTALICGVVNCIDDLRPFLNQWQALLGTHDSVARFGEFVTCECAHLLKHALSDVFFHRKRKAQVTQIVEWITSDYLRKHAMELGPAGAELQGYLEWF